MSIGVCECGSLMAFGMLKGTQLAREREHSSVRHLRSSLVTRVWLVTVYTVNSGFLLWHAEW